MDTLAGDHGDAHPAQQDEPTRDEAKCVECGKIVDIGGTLRDQSHALSATIEAMLMVRAGKTITQAVARERANNIAMVLATVVRR
jgi:hypothetical protein